MRAGSVSLSCARIAASDGRGSSRGAVAGYPRAKIGDVRDQPARIVNFNDPCSRSMGSLNQFPSKSGSDGLVFQVGMVVLNIEDRADGVPDPLGRAFDVAVPKVGVAECHAGIGVPQHP